MNAIFSISMQSMEELIQLCAVPGQIISPRDSTPITAVVQDVATGLFRLTKNHIRINERQFMNLMSNITKFTGEIPAPYEVNNGAKYYTGRQALSMILPDRVNLEQKTENYNETKTDEENENYKVVIKNGELLGGAISKSVFQARTKGIVHNVFNEYGPDETRQLFDNAQHIICDWLVYDGFSTGISDLILSDKSTEQFKEEISKMKVEAYDIIRSIHEGRFDNNSTKNNHEFFEYKVNTELNKANSSVGDKALGQIHDRYNRLINMIKSKSKGNTINVAQMIGCVGQQNVEGNRIPYGFDDRTLPHYTKFDDGPESRGFVENSFIKGLSPQEFFFHAMGGREGLIDTACQSVTGDTSIVIIENDQPKTVKIGEWIDSMMAEHKDKVELKGGEWNMECLPLDSPVFIPTADNNGVSSWGEITMLTRHDPGSQLYEVKTLGGRSVIVTASKSILLWNEEKNAFEQRLTTDAKVGDFMPALATINNDYASNMINMEVSASQKRKNDVVLDKIVEIKPVDIADGLGYAKVYDLTIPTTLNFVLANGLNVADKLVSATASVKSVILASANLAQRLTALLIFAGHQCSTETSP